jgi:hypothetical protein
VACFGYPDNREKSQNLVEMTFWSGEIHQKWGSVSLSKVLMLVDERHSVVSISARDSNLRILVLFTELLRNI